MVSIEGPSLSTLRQAIAQTADSLKGCHENLVRKELIRHLARLQDIEYALLAVVQVNYPLEESDANL